MTDLLQANLQAVVDSVPLPERYRLVRELENWFHPELLSDAELGEEADRTIERLADELGSDHVIVAAFVAFLEVGHNPELVVELDGEGGHARPAAHLSTPQYTIAHKS